jgi:hypothetical protein
MHHLPARVERRHEGAVRTKEQPRIVLLVREAEQLFSDLLGCPQRPGNQQKQPHTMQSQGALGKVGNVLTEFLGALVRLVHVRGTHAFDRHERSAHGQAQRQFLVMSCRALRKRLEDLETFREVSNGFGIRGMLGYLLSGTLPVLHRLGGEPSLRVVLRQQFRLRRHCLGKLRLQHLGNLLMVLLSGATQQRLIRHLLDQGVLEAIGRLWRHAPLVQQLGVDELRQGRLQLSVGPARHALEERIGELPPERGAQLRHRFRSTEPIQPRHERILQRGRNRHAGTGARKA